MFVVVLEGIVGVGWILTGLAARFSRKTENVYYLVTWNLQLSTADTVSKHITKLEQKVHGIQDVGCNRLASDLLHAGLGFEVTRDKKYRLLFHIGFPLSNRSPKSI